MKGHSIILSCPHTGPGAGCLRLQAAQRRGPHGKMLANLLAFSQTNLKMYNPLQNKVRFQIKIIQNIAVPSTALILLIQDYLEKVLCIAKQSFYEDREKIDGGRRCAGHHIWASLP